MPAQALSESSSGGEGGMDRAETDPDDESLGNEEKPKKLKKKKKKVKKEGEDGSLVKKKKKKKKKTVAEPEPDADADGENAEASAGGFTASTEPNTPSGTGTDDEEGLGKLSLKMPVRRQSNMLDDIEISDVESDDDDATAKASGQSSKRSNSTGTYDQQTHVRFLKAQKAKQQAEAAAAAAARDSYASPQQGGEYALSDDDYDDDDDGDSPPRRPQRPVRTRPAVTDKRYKSNSLGALDKKKHQMIMRKKASIRIPAGSRRHMRYMSSDDEDADSDAASSSHGSESEGEMALGGGGGGGGRSSGDDIPSRPVRSRGGSGQAKYRSTSTGVLEKNVRDQFLNRMSDDEGRSQDGTSDEDDAGSGGSGRPRRPQRARRTSNQPRYRSTSAGVLDKNARDIYNSRAPPNPSTFVKPRKRSGAAIKAKETMQRSAEESSLHQAQPNIRVALPRLRSVGALNARGSGSNSRRSSRDRYNSDDSDDSADSPVERKAQSERVLRTSNLGSSNHVTDDDSSSDGSSESEAVMVASAPLPKSFRPTRNWADSSKQLDQLPSVRRTSSAQSVNKKPSATDAIAPPPMSGDDDNDDIWTETLKGVAEKKKKKKTKVKKTRSSDSMDSISEHKPKAKTKKQDKVRKSSAPGLESGSYH